MHDVESWSPRVLRASINKGKLEIYEDSTRKPFSVVELFWARVSSGAPSGSTSSSYQLREADMIILVKPQRSLSQQESWAFTCRKKWLPYLLHSLAVEGGVLEKEVESFFHMEGSCGKGGYGTIRRGFPIVSEYYSPCEVAVKVASERDVRHELKMLSVAGRHPSVIKHHGAFRGNNGGRGPWSLVLEFYPSGDLWHYCVDCLQLSTALSFLHNLLLGLHHIHERKIFHRDVKPENILVTSDERAVLCDFGVAEIVCSGTGLTKMGRGLTPQYASPEMISRNSMNLTGDVYAAGATFHFMMTLQYVASSLKKERHSWFGDFVLELNFEKPNLRELPVSCQDLLERMICPEWKRLSSQEAVRHYAFWALADDVEDDVKSLPAGRDSICAYSADGSTNLGSSSLAIFASSRDEAWASISAPMGSGAFASDQGQPQYLAPVASSESRSLSSRPVGGPVSDATCSVDTAALNGLPGQVDVQDQLQQMELDQCVQSLQKMLQIAPEAAPSSIWSWRQRLKPRPPGVKAPRAKRTSVSHWLQHRWQAFMGKLRPRRRRRVSPGEDFCKLF
ncbi:tsuA [Symbiodinium microadriaticum]|nr:tsuA [Symbiodinium microadriaticum]